ncbi:MAG: hypothetical protein BWY09_00687 [Candidatus Hydrogenedentes bacterium ADurb.Bin179]|nr:MAG: hypothetical protein BWY09_00687 [Candidatus Hydrogenedentes bacterium ADurb.Bin179]
MASPGGNIPQSAEIVSAKTDIVISNSDTPTTTAHFICTAVGCYYPPPFQQGSCDTDRTAGTAAGCVSITRFTVGADGPVNMQRFSGRQVGPSSAMTSAVTVNTA